MKPVKTTVKSAGGEQSPHGSDRFDRATRLLKEALLLIEGQADGGGKDYVEETDRLMRLPEVLRQTGMCRSAVYDQMARGLFPRSLKIGPRAASWSAKEVQKWIAMRKDEAPNAERCKI